MARKNNLYLSHILEEYKLCQQKALNLEERIWKSAGVFGIGSSVGFIALVNIQSKVSVYVIFLVTFLAITILFTWYRFALRWLSIEQVIIRRMEDIEKELSLRSNLYICACDDIVSKKSKKKVIQPDEYPDINFARIEEFKTFNTRGYEWRGIQPMLNFFLWISISIWIIYAIFNLFTLFLPKYDSIEIILTFVFLFFYLKFFLILLWNFWQKN